MSGIDFQLLCRCAGLPAPVAEYMFCPGRKWRLDYAWPGQKIALEVEGGVWTGGRHLRGKGFSKDMEKYNTLSELGWRLFRCTPDDMRSMAILGLLKRVLKKEENLPRMDADEHG